MATVSIPFTFSAGSTIVASEHNDNFSTLYNEFNGNISNANISNSASIAASKLDLSSVSQAVTFSGNTLIGSANQGDVLYDNGTKLTRLTPGTAGQVLRTEGAAANPTFGYPADLTIASQAQGDVLYYDGSNWVRLAAGTDGQFLKTQGSGANPEWANSGLILVDTTTISTSNSGDISLSTSKFYKIFVSITATSADDTVSIRFSNDSDGYVYFRVGGTNPGSFSALDSGEGAGSSLVLGDIDNTSDTQFLTADLSVDTYLVGTSRARFNGHCTSVDTSSSTLEYASIGGHWTDSSTALSSFEVLSLSGATLTGKVTTYEMTQ